MPLQFPHRAMRHSVCSLRALPLQLAAVLTAFSSVSARDWPQWCGSDSKNMVSTEKGLPETFVPGEKLPEGKIDLPTARNVKWGVRIGNGVYSAPSVAKGKIFVGGLEKGNG